ncbi:MAG: hypothetical protein JOZ69_22035, partial [Myxococcales bacterium]|nr:hypothetical protein [Myxococcales bacterium]
MTTLGSRAPAGGFGGGGELEIVATIGSEPGSLALGPGAVGSAAGRPESVADGVGAGPGMAAGGGMGVMGVIGVGAVVLVTAGAGGVGATGDARGAAAG